MKVLGLDPGASNFAWATLTSERLFDTGMLALSGEDLMNRIEHFRLEFVALLASKQPDAVVIERFMTRTSASFNNEVINLFIGVVVSECLQYKIKVHMVTSSAWKRRFTGLTGMSSSSILLGNRTPHECDALSMAAYEIDDVLFRTIMAVTAVLREWRKMHRRSNGVVKLHNKLAKLLTK